MCGALVRHMQRLWAVVVQEIRLVGSLMEYMILCSAHNRYYVKLRILLHIGFVLLFSPLVLSTLNKHHSLRFDPPQTTP